MEILSYILETDDFFINPIECRIIEEFRGESKLIGRILREKVPHKPRYVIMKQQRHGFPEVIDLYAHINTASEKVLKYSFEWIKQLLKKEKGLGFFLNYQIINKTNYREERYNHIKKSEQI